MKIAISTESTADLPEELVIKNNIFVIPLEINFEIESFLDGKTIKTQDVFDYVDRTNQLPKTAARGIEEYKEFFSNILKEYDAVVHIAFSNELSSSCSYAIGASKQLQNVVVIDSLNLSSGHGMLVLNAVNLVKKETKLDIIQQQLEEIREKISVSFIINTMKYLFKGGRCSTIQYLGANLLKIKPSIVVKNGKMNVGKKYMGRLNDCAIKYINDTLANAGEIDYDLIFVTYSSNQILKTDELVSLVKEKGFKNVILNQAGCTISSHCGPECMGIIFKTK